MFKKKSLFAFGMATLALCGVLTACNDKEENPDDFFETSEVTPDGFEMYIVGSNWNNWDTATIKEADPSCTFTKASSTEYTFNAVVTEEMNAGWWGFKFIADNSWTSQYGMEDIDYENCNDAFKAIVTAANPDVVDYASYQAKFKEGSSNRSNVSFPGTEGAVGTYTVKYNPINFDTVDANSITYTKKFVVDFTPASKAAA